jgi:L-lactate dehydrogenase complex protein LldG
VIDLERNNSAREAILRTIRENLAASVPYDAVRSEAHADPKALLHTTTLEENGNRKPEVAAKHESDPPAVDSLIEIFGRNLEAVGGHCILARGEDEVVLALQGIISSLKDSPLRVRRIALSDVPLLGRLLDRIEVSIDEVAVTPSGAELFGFDVGISTAQVAIAETGTLMLDSESERHRLVSLVPPVHIAIVDAGNICLTLGEALSVAARDGEVSPTVTFITGPSRTADIELTLAIGVHGPQELHVIINDSGG